MFDTLFIDETDKINFLLSERLGIMIKLNETFNKVNKITENSLYWKFIISGLYDLDTYCRKVSVSLI